MQTGEGLMLGQENRLLEGEEEDGEILGVGELYMGRKLQGKRVTVCRKRGKEQHHVIRFLLVLHDKSINITIITLHVSSTSWGKG
jgi:hypothetical protein